MLLAACGGDTSSESSPAVVIDGQQKNPTANAETGDPVPASDEELALEFVACMRNDGIDFPDPQIETDGSVVLLPGGPVASGVPIGSPEFQDAIDTCGSIVDGASFLPTNQIDANELEDTLLAFAGCVREQGEEISDPDLSAGFPPPGGPAALFGGFDPTDPANADLVATCRQAALDATGFEPPGGAR